MPTAKNKINFNEAFAELEEINQWFQQENIDLDEGLKKFKRGMELINLCKKRLTEVDNKFQEVKKEFSD